MQIEIIFYGQLTEITGMERYLADGCQDIDDVRTQLLEKFPDLHKVQFFIAVNNQMVRDNILFKGPVTIACMPPFSGG